MARGSVAILTGASGGIGGALAPRLARRGYHVALVGRRREVLEALVERLGGPSHATALPLDLADPDAVSDAAIRPLVEAHGPAEVLVNNAGFGGYAPFLAHPRQRQSELFQVNYLAAAELIRLCLPSMVRRGRGYVINVGSMAAVMGPWGHTGYAGAKAALASLTQSLAAEYAHSGVHFCLVQPGIVHTRFFDHPEARPLWQRVRRKAVSPEAVAKVIDRLIDRPHAERTVPAHYGVLRWLRAISPGLTQRLVAHQSRPVDTTDDDQTHIAAEPLADRKADLL